MTQSRDIHRCPERPEIVVVADSVEFARLSVQKEALLRDELHSADSETGFIDVCQTLSVVNLRHSPI